MVPCLPKRFGRRAVIAMPKVGFQGVSCRSFSLSHVPALTVDNTDERLIGFLEGRPTRM